MTGVADTPSAFLKVASPDTLDELELDRALEVVARHAVSELGAAAVRARRPLGEHAAIQSQVAQVEELRVLLRDEGRIRPVPVTDLSPILQQASVEGGVLESLALIAVAGAVDAMRENAATLERVGESAPLVAALLAEVPSAALSRTIMRSLAPDGSVRDEASQELKRARRDVREVRRRLIAHLEKLSRDAGSDREPTLREGRYVMAVPSDARSRVDGIVHGESASGATLFVEPTALVGEGNALRIAEAREARAVLAVLRELTGQVRDALAPLEAGWRMSVAFDDLYARASYALSCHAACPTVTASGPLSVRTGFHPLIRELSTAVPFDLELADGGVLLISGPNAGGKTVLLKAVGVLALLTQCGVIPPVGSGSVFPVFRTIRADIGDHQSIDESLSTFSARLASLRDTLATVGPGALVLLDELGGGTDPVEGSALATAVLDALHTRGASAVATTHLHDLKEAAARSDHMTNASLEFDADTLEPTYRLRVGQPGRSYGLAIARRLGLPADVIDAAESLIPDAVMSLDATLAEVQRRERELEAREVAAAGLRDALEAERTRLIAARDEVDRRDHEVSERARAAEHQAREQARRFLLESRKRVEDALALARAAVDEATAREARRLVEEGVQHEATAIEQLESLAAKQGWRIKGQPTPDIEKVRRRIVNTAPPPPAVAIEASSEVDVRGMRVDEAERVVLAGLDAAIVADLPMFRIIHGKGTGALRGVVADLLRDDRRVVRYAVAPPEQGGAGVTVAELR